jgi:rhomboid family GlyGly-CTERM serine protease
VTLVLTFAAVGAFFVPSAGDGLEYSSPAIAAGQVWRLATGHLVHWSPGHLWWDASMFALLGALAERRSRGEFVGCLAVASGTIAMSTWVLSPETEVFRGLSGIDWALFAWLAVSLAGEDITRGRWKGALVGAALCAAFVAKTAHEMRTGGSVVVDLESAGVVTFPLAHVAGALAGSVVAVWGLLRERVRSTGPLPRMRAGPSAGPSVTG